MHRKRNRIVTAEESQPISKKELLRTIWPRKRIEASTATRRRKTVHLDAESVLHDIGDIGIIHSLLLPPPHQNVPNRVSVYVNQDYGEGGLSSGGVAVMTETTMTAETAKTVMAASLCCNL